MEISFTERGTVAGEVGFCCCLCFERWKQEFNLGTWRCLSDIQMEILSGLQDIHVLILGEKSGLKIDI